MLVILLAYINYSQIYKYLNIRIRDIFLTTQCQHFFSDGLKFENLGVSSDAQNLFLIYQYVEMLSHNRILISFRVDNSKYRCR